MWRRDVDHEPVHARSYVLANGSAIARDDPHARRVSLARDKPVAFCTGRRRQEHIYAGVKIGNLALRNTAGQPHRRLTPDIVGGLMLGPPMGQGEKLQPVVRALPENSLYKVKALMRRRIADVGQPHPSIFGRSPGEDGQIGQPIAQSLRLAEARLPV